MKYNLIALACAILLMFGIGTQAHYFPGDTDKDGTPDNPSTPSPCDGIEHIDPWSMFDSCQTIFNFHQYDADADGYGDVCDADYDGDKVVGLFDYSTFKNHFMSEYEVTSNDGCAGEDDPWSCCTGEGTGTCDYLSGIDHNCSGKVNLFDFATFKNLYGQPLDEGNTCAPDCPLRGGCHPDDSPEDFWIMAQAGHRLTLGTAGSIPIQAWMSWNWEGPRNVNKVNFTIHTSEELTIPTCEDSNPTICTSFLGGEVPQIWECVCKKLTAPEGYNYYFVSMAGEYQSGPTLDPTDFEMGFETLVAFPWIIDSGFEGESSYVGIYPCYIYDLNYQPIAGCSNAAPTPGAGCIAVDD